MSVREILAPGRIWTCDYCHRDVAGSPDDPYAPPAHWIWVQLRAGDHEGQATQPEQRDYCSLTCASAGTLLELRGLGES